MSSQFDLRASLRYGEERGRTLLRESFLRKIYIAAFCLLTAAVFVTLLQTITLSSRILEIENKMSVQRSTAHSQANDAEVARLKIAELRKGQAFAHSVLSVYEFLAGLSEVAQEESLLFRLDYSAEGAMLSGEARGDREILVFAERVSALLSVLRADIPEIRDTSDSQGGIKKFSMRCTLR